MGWKELLEKFNFGTKSAAFISLRHDSKYFHTTNHNRGITKKRRLMAKKSRRINRRRGGK